MKPRLVPAEPTVEDDLVWDHVYDRWVDVTVGDQLFVLSDLSDRHDADLMLAAQRDRFLGNICPIGGNVLDWEFDVIMRLGTWRMYWPAQS